MKKTKKKQAETNYYLPPSPPPNNDSEKLVIENFSSSSAPVGRPPPLVDVDLLQDLAAFISAREDTADQTSPPPTPMFTDSCQMDLDLSEFLNDDDEIGPDTILFPELP